MKYVVLDKHEANGSGYEVRKYVPHKRTISVAERLYFVPIPYTVFLRYWDKNSTVLFNSIAKESDDAVFHSCLPNVYSNFGVCLGGWGGQGWSTHFRHSPLASMDKLVQRFWQSDFNDYDNWPESKRILRYTYGYLKDWRLLTLEQAVEKVSYGRMPLNDFILQCIDGLPMLLRYD